LVTHLIITTTGFEIETNVAGEAIRMREWAHFRRRFANEGHKI
jgi:hypothetical protein